MYICMYVIAKATDDSPWTSRGASSIYFSANSMCALEIWFFIEVKLLFECFLHLCFGDIPGFRFFFPKAVYSNIIPPTLILQIFGLIGVIIKGTAHLFDLFFDFI